MTTDNTTTTPPRLGPDGRPLRLRWQLAGTRYPAHGNAEFRSAWIADDGGPDDAVDHEWHEADGLLPACLVVTGWTYPACHREYDRLWKERRDAERAAKLGR